MEARNTRKRWFTRRRLGIFALVLGIMALIWWWWQPPGFMPIASYRAQVRGISRNGFLLREYETEQFAFYDWNGHLLWRVTPPSEMRLLSMSPDGHILAGRKYEGDKIHFCIWRDGQLIGKQSLLFNLPAHHRINGSPYFDKCWVLNSGKVLVWLNTMVSDLYESAPTPMYILSGNHIEATGILPALSNIAPDGTLQEARFVQGPLKRGRRPGPLTVHFSKLVKKGNRILWAPCFTTPMMKELHRIKANFYEFAAGSSVWVFNETGIFYGPSGRITQFSPGGHVCMNSCDTGLIVRYNKYFYDQFQLYYPRTKSTWTVKGERSSWVTADEKGQYALVPRCIKVTEWVNAGLAHIPILPDQIRYRRPEYSIELYERPGHLRARMRSHGGRFPGSEIITTTDFGSITSELAPDGRSLLLEGNSVKDSMKGVCTLYRW